MAGTATFPWLVESISKVAVIVVSKSEAETFNWLLSNSKRKLSRIGKVLLLLITLPKTCNCFNKYELDTINFIILYFKIVIWFYISQIYSNSAQMQKQIINIYLLYFLFRKNVNKNPKSANITSGNPTVMIWAIV